MLVQVNTCMLLDVLYQANEEQRRIHRPSLHPRFFLVPPLMGTELPGFCSTTCGTLSHAGWPLAGIHLHPCDLTHQEEPSKGPPDTSPSTPKQLRWPPHSQPSPSLLPPLLAA
jgi:hypothetical protein